MNPLDEYISRIREIARCVGHMSDAELLLKFKTVTTECTVVYALNCVNVSERDIDLDLYMLRAMLTWLDANIDLSSIRDGIIKEIADDLSDNSLAQVRATIETAGIIDSLFHKPTIN